MMVPTGSALRATRTFGPIGTDRRGVGLLGPGSGEHVLGHDRGDDRNDQRSDEQRDFLDVHGDYASPEGSLKLPSDNQAKWLRKRWASNHIPPTAMATPYGTSGRPGSFRRSCDAVPDDDQSQQSAGDRHDHDQLQRLIWREP